MLSLLPEETIEEQWHSLRETWKATCTTALGRKTRKHKEWITSDTWTLINERKNLKTELTRRKIKRKSTNCRPSTGKRTDR